MSASGPQEASLSRQLGLAALIFYGVGDILGAGIYALVGEIAGIAGSLSWLAFLIALAVASFTGLTYAELGSRYPRSGGEAHYCGKAFRSPWIARVIGWTVFCSGVVSLATVSRAFSGYLGTSLPEVPAELLVGAILVVLALINWIGIRFSSATNIVFTVLEASGLLLIICVGLAWFATAPAPEQEAVAAGRPAGILTLMQAASLAFFAFIGFEDLVNVAEETRHPRRDLPIAILASSAIAGSLYICVILVATHVVPPQILAESEAPLMIVVQRAAPWFPTWIFTGIALFAVANTGLLNFVTASRLLYGMSRDGLLPQMIGRLDQRRRTPTVAIGIVLAAAMVLALSGSLGYLAGTTSVLLLSVFLTMNLVLIRVKRRSLPVAGAFNIPVLIPICGLIVCSILLAVTPWQQLASGLALVAAGGLANVSSRVKSRSSADTEDADQDTPPSTPDPT